MDLYEICFQTVFPCSYSVLCSQTEDKAMNLIHSFTCCKFISFYVGKNAFAHAVLRCADQCYHCLRGKIPGFGRLQPYQTFYHFLFVVERYVKHLVILSLPWLFLSSLKMSNIAGGRLYQLKRSDISFQKLCCFPALTNHDFLEQCSLLQQSITH